MDPFRSLGIEVPPIRWHWPWFRGRTILLAATIALGLIGFLSGVSVTERPGVVHAGLLVKVYYTLGLFLFGGMDLGTPEAGPWFGRASLWIAYFVAPMITASAVIEAVLRMVGADAFLLSRLKGHIVVAGCGRLTQLYLERLRQTQPTIGVVVVGTPAEAHAFANLRELYRAQVVEGDITSEALLRRLRLEHAARVLLLTDDDFTNLDAGARIHHLVPSVDAHVVVHVSDLRFLRSMAKTGLARRCQVFNGHQLAAAHLVQVHLLEHFERTEPCDVVVLAGFGRFGQSVLDELQKRAEGAFDRVIIVDLEATQRTSIFAEQVGFGSGYRREIIDGDLRDPEAWAQVERALTLSKAAPVFVVGSGDDRTDLRIGMRVASRFSRALVIARSDRQWSFAEDFSRESGLHVFSVARLVAESMPEPWFGPRTERHVGIDPAAVRSPSASMLMPRQIVNTATANPAE